MSHQIIGFMISITNEFVNKLFLRSNALILEAFQSLRLRADE